MWALHRCLSLSDQGYPAGCRGYYFTGDGARRDEDGYFWILGKRQLSVAQRGTAPAQHSVMRRTGPPWGQLDL